MKSKLCFGTALTLAFSANAVSAFAALPGVDLGQLILKKKLGIAARVEAQGKTAACTNFSGHWVGSCRIEVTGSDAVVIPAEVTIQQLGCDILEFGGQVQPMGGSTSNTVSGKIDDNSFLTQEDNQFDWSADQKTLVVRSHVVARVFGAPAVVVDTAGASVIQEGKLLFGLQGDGFQVGCTYDKHH